MNFVLLLILFLNHRSVQLLTDDTSSLNGSRLEFQENRHIRTNILFSKTHKTGSSSMQNILMRFGLKNLLNIMVPPEGNYIGYTRPLTSKSIGEALMPVDRKFNIFLCHTRYHPNIMNFMHNDTIRITLLRYPPKAFESLFKFFHFDLKYNITFDKLLITLPNTPANFAREDDLVRSKNPREDGLRKSTNQCCADLGLVVDGETTESMIQNFIRHVDAEFDFVMITEYFNECLVLLADLMNWPLEYVVYIPLLARPKWTKSKSLTAEEEGKLSDLNNCDSLLYDYFLEKLRQRILNYGVDRLLKNVRQLHKMNDDFHSKCIQAETNSGFWGTVGYTLKPNPDWDCTYAAMHEFPILDEIRKNQTKRFAKEKKLVNFVYGEKSVS